MITDGLNPLAVLLFVGAVLTALALAATYAFARITKRERLAQISSRALSAVWVVYLVLILLGSAGQSQSCARAR